MQNYKNNPYQEFFQKVAIKKTGNVANKNMQDAYYSEINPSDTDLKTLIAQSMDTPACL